MSKRKTATGRAAGATSKAARPVGSKTGSRTNAPSPRNAAAGAPARPAPARPAPARPAPAAKGKHPASAPAAQPLVVAPEVPLPLYPIVGIGASAGGLEAVTQLLQALPATPGVALVLVQHLAPDHKSRLPELLAAVSPVPVESAADGVRVERNKLYVVPPDVQVEIRRGVLHLSGRPQDRTQHLPIDFFFRSLADYAQVRAIGVVLSGTASDGAAGLREIKGAGGITFAQEPGSAAYDGMPRAAVATGMVDHVLTPRDVARELVRISQHPLVATAPRPRAGESPVEVPEEQMARIFVLLRSATGVDFTHYKQPTIKRRLHRRMLLHKIASVGQYVRFLEDNEGEVRDLYEDILIHVTRFFRDPESFKALRENIFPRLLEGRAREDPVRVWVPGCSTGEEAYSVAIALLEYLPESGGNVSVQVFATDISEAAIEHARAGVYNENIAGDVSAERLRRFFTKPDGNYRISKRVRDVCVFARQDLTRDPPFSRLDLVVCRNVLIYLGPVLQQRLMSVFHYALKPTGFLMLGSAESIGTHADLFLVVDKRHRVYAKRMATARAAAESRAIDGGAGAGAPRGTARPAGRGLPVPLPEPRTGGVQAEVNRVILSRYSPPGVLVDGDLNIIQFRGQTGPYLEPAPGDATLNVLKMARDGLLYALRTALFEARTGNAPVRREGLRVKVSGTLRALNLEVVPLVAPGESRHYLVLFEEVRLAGAGQAADGERAADGDGVFSRGKRGKDGKRGEGGKAAAGKAKSGDAAAREAGERIRHLQDELAASREYLQSIIQDLEAANEELQSANEEILSSNEELQSTNEELDTAKEELQSTNEELNTLNEELHGRNEELSRVNSDLVNLLASVHIAIVMVDGNLRIRRFTPAAERMLNLIPGDVGRPIGDIKPSFDAPDLEKLIAEVVDTVSVKEQEVTDRQGNRLSLRVRPYKNMENKIDGAVLAMFDTESTHRRAEAQAAWQYANAILEAVHEPLLVLDADLRVRTANRPFLQTFQVSGDDTEGKLVYELGNGQWNIPKLRSLLEQVLPANQHIDGYDVELDFPGIGRRRMRLNARRVDHGDREADRILLAMVDMSEAPPWGKKN